MTRKRWRIEAIPFEAVFDRDNEIPYCIRLTDQQIALLLSQTNYLYWGTRYVTESGDKLTSEQTEVITKAAAALEAVLLLAEGCNVYTIELVDCNLVLKSDGEIISTVDISACIAPPVAIGFDAANCNLMFTQGNIYSPYVGGDWATVFDWNIETFKECLGPSQQPPPVDLLESTVCDMATGAATLILADAKKLMEIEYAALSSPAISWAIDALADIDFKVRAFWESLGLAQFFVFAPTPDAGLITMLASLEAQVKLTHYFYCTMSIDGDGNIVWDRAAWRTLVQDDFFSANGTDTILSYVDGMLGTDVMRQYFIFAGIEFTGSDCSAIDCYETSTCLDYSDTMLLGLGDRTRLFDASHAYGQGTGTQPQQSGSLVAGQGIGGGYAIVCDIPAASGQRLGGFFVDLGRECTVINAGINIKTTANGGTLGALHIRFRDDTGAVLLNRQTNITKSTTYVNYTDGGSPSPTAGVRYISFDIVTNFAAMAYLCNPTVNVS